MVTVTRLDATLGARVTDVRLGDLGADDWRAVEAAFLAHALLVFPGQHLSADAQVAFGTRVGEIEILRKGQQAVPISNQKPDGSVMTAAEKRYQSLRGNEGWHTDSSYMPLAAKASILSAQLVPAAGGETEFCDMRAAYDALDAAMQARIAGLSAYHSIYASQAKAGYTFRTGEGYGFHTLGAPLRPLVKVHPATGRKALFIGRHAYRIPGMDDQAAQALLDALLAHAVQPPRHYAHRWQPGDVVMWDNRCVLHRACPYDYDQPRVMRHVRIAGDPASELAPTGRDERADGYEPLSAAG